MKVLAIDTATRACSAALWEDGTVRARQLTITERGQSEALLPMVLAVLAEAGADFADLDLVAVTVGPGAFTGLRIGLAAARGMALAAGLPCLGVTTLEAVAHGVGADERAAGSVLVALETKRADVYVQAFDGHLQPLGEPRAVTADQIPTLVPAGPVVVVGDAAPKAAQALEAAGGRPTISPAPGVPDAAVVAALAAARFRPGRLPAAPRPLYLRPPDATLPRDGGRRRPRRRP